MQDISKRINSNKTKHLLVKNELKKLQKFDSSYLRGKIHFERDGAQNYLVFQPMYRFLRGLQVLVVVIIYIFGNLKDCLMKELILLRHHYGTKTRVKFSESCLKQDKATYNGTTVNIYVVYEISKNYNISSYPTLENCFFGAVSLTKHVGIDQHKYSGYGIGFDRKGEFLFGNGFGRNVIILGTDMSSLFMLITKQKIF